MQLGKIKELLNKYGLSPNKSLGQNFLMDENILDKIVETANINTGDHIVEVGPGLGVLTKKLAKKAKKVTALDIDKGLIPLLKNELSDYNNVKILHQDALKWQVPTNPYKVVANIPYYITSPLISHFLRSKNRPMKIVLLMQKKVARKICAKEKSLNVLAINVQIFGKPKIQKRVARECFYPKPKVESAILEIEMFKEPLVTSSQKELEHFFKIVHAGFSHKRKTILNSIQRGMIIEKENLKNALEKSGINPSARAQHLSISDWKKLASKIKN